MRIVFPPRDEAAERKLQRELGIPAMVAAVLASRGITDLEEAHRFLYPSLEELGDPRKLPDYEAAEKAILGARDRKELIFIHGDYDTDGVTSAALLKRFLETIGCTVHAHVPHRMKEGYGIHMDAVYRAKEMGASVFLTCDCGISAHEQVAAAQEAGMTVVVTDHHTVPPDLPQATALVNPHRSDSEYPFRDLSGVGVAFRFAEGLTRTLGMPVDKFRRAFLDLTVLGTIADVMPLVGENRVIARHGLVQLAQTRKEGLLALIQEANLGERAAGGALLSSDVGFALGPRLNATGRIDDAARALQLLISKDPLECSKLAKEIEDLNRKRREQQDEAIRHAMEMVEQMSMDDQYAIVVGHTSWHPGIIGLVAGKVREKYNRPAFVMSYNMDTGDAKGSARSIPGFNLAECLRAFPDLVQGGGHAMAAGFGMPLKNIEAVKRAFNRYARERLSADDFVPVVEVSALMPGSEISFDAVEKLEMLAPFGMANPAPVFATQRATVSLIKPTKNENIVQMELQLHQGGRFMGTTFTQAEAALALDRGDEIGIVFKPEIEEYRGVRKLKFRLNYFTRDMACMPAAVPSG